MDPTQFAGIPFPPNGAAGGWPANYLPAPAVGAPGAAPVGILNGGINPDSAAGQQAYAASIMPPNGAAPNNNQNNAAAFAQAAKLLNPPLPTPPPLQPIQAARPVGSAAGYDPARLIAAMRGQIQP